MKKKLIVIAGPTASGKTATSVALAKKISGEIISADSMQVYKYMDIGSAKVTKEEMGGIKHYLVDCLDPSEAFDVHRFQDMSQKAMAEIYENGKIPILCGGTGFYIQSVVRSIDFQPIDEKDKEVRTKVENFAKENGKEALYEWLFRIDPESCASIHPNNEKRVIRAIEYYLLTGQKMSLHNQRQRQKKTPYDLTYVVLDMNRETLYKRIDARVDQMIRQGLVKEVKALKEMGYNQSMTSMQGLGYKELLDYLDNRCSLDEAVYKIKRDTRHFAKRQLTWFRREEDTLFLSVEDHDFDPEKLADRIQGLI